MCFCRTSHLVEPDNTEISREMPHSINSPSVPSDVPSSKAQLVNLQTRVRHVEPDKAWKISKRHPPSSLEYREEEYVVRKLTN